MRWTDQAIDFENAGTLPGMSRIAGLIRSVRTPDFAGITFHEVLAKSALNRMPRGSPLPFGWTLNPYRGCSHACVYCFARGTHSYLDFDTGQDFDTQIVVKTNIAAVVRRELARASWCGEHVAMGTNTDPYQRAEGRYRLMPGVIEALSGSRTPFSILTKGTMLARDIPLLVEAAQYVPVGLGISLALLDPDLQATLEPGTPGPRARLELVRKVTAAGLPCGVFMAPLLPYLSDGREQIRDLIAQIVEAGATGVSGMLLHLRPGAREWFFRWLAMHRPDLIPVYENLYSRGANAMSSYRAMISERIKSVRAEFGLTGFDGSLIRGASGGLGGLGGLGGSGTSDEPGDPDGTSSPGAGIVRANLSEQCLGTLHASQQPVLF